MSQWHATLDELAEFQQEQGRQGVRLWYRGQSSAEWPIRSRIHRHVLEYFVRTGHHFGDAGDLEFLREEYKGLYRRFKGQAWHLLDSMERNEWGIIFRMQHHGFPTRLLDWTKSFACALYFAQLDRNPTEDAVVYVLNPEGLNQISTGRRGLIALDDTQSQGNFDTRPYHPRWVTETIEPSTIAVEPYLSNPRMVAQSAAFTLAGDSFVPFESQFDGQLAKAGVLRKIILPAEAYRDVEKFLSIVGASHYQYFPDLEGLRATYRTEMEGTIKHTLDIIKSEKRKKPTRKK